MDMGAFLFILFFALLFGAISGAVASGKGYPYAGFFLLGACFPLIGLIIAMCLRNTRA